MTTSLYRARYELDETSFVQAGAWLSGNPTRPDDCLAALVHFLALGPTGLSLRLASDGAATRSSLRLYAAEDREDDLVRVLHILQSAGAVSEIISSRDIFDGHFSGVPAQLVRIADEGLSTRGQKIGCRFRALDSAQELLSMLCLQGASVRYQINLVKAAGDSEVLRRLKKWHVRLEEDRAIPRGIIREQQMLIDAMKHPFVAEEFFACADHDSLRAVQEALQMIFADKFEEMGFPIPDFAGEMDDFAADLYTSGFHSSLFEEIGDLESCRQRLHRDDLATALKIKPVSTVAGSGSSLPRPITGNGFDVFISHSSQDHHLAFAICHFLEQQGIRCWIAPRDIAPGEVWSQSIMRGIRACRVTLLLVSGHANQSRYVLREVEQSVSNNNVIVPLRIEDVHPPDSIRFFVSSHHWFDAISPPLEQHLPQLKEAIANHLKKG